MLILFAVDATCFMAYLQLQEASTRWLIRGYCYNRFEDSLTLTL